jgi:hypothetical protein
MNRSKKFKKQLNKRENLRKACPTEVLTLDGLGGGGVLKHQGHIYEELTYLRDRSNYLVIKKLTVSGFWFSWKASSSASVCSRVSRT